MKKALTTALIGLLALGMASVVSAVPQADSTANADSGTVNSKDVQINRDTTEWSAFYGDLNSTVTLSDGSNTFYEWTAGSTIDGSAVLATQGSWTGNAGDLSKVTLGTDPINNVNVEGTDSANNTYKSSGSLNVGAIDVTGTDTTQVQQSGDPFTQYLLSDTSDNAVFATEASSGSTGYDGSTAVDYQLLVGNPGDATGTTYTFYAEIA